MPMRLHMTKDGPAYRGDPRSAAKLRGTNRQPADVGFASQNCFPLHMRVRRREVAWNGSRTSQTTYRTPDEWLAAAPPLGCGKLTLMWRATEWLAGAQFGTGS